MNYLENELNEKINRVRAALYFAEDKGVRLIAACIPEYISESDFLLIIIELRNTFEEYSIEQQQLAITIIEYLNYIRNCCKSFPSAVKIVKEHFNQIIEIAVISEIANDNNKTIKNRNE